MPAQFRELLVQMCPQSGLAGLQPIQTLPNAVEPLPNAVEPLLNAVEPLPNAVEPCSTPPSRCVNAVEPLVNAVEPLVNAVEPLVNAVEPLVKAIEPLFRHRSSVRGQATIHRQPGPWKSNRRAARDSDRIRRTRLEVADSATSLQSRIAETATPLKLCVDAPLPFRVRQIGFPGHRERLDLGNQPLMQLPVCEGIQTMFDAPLAHIETRQAMISSA